MSGIDPRARVYRRVLRRETHASRSAAGIVAATLLVLLCAAAGVGVVWWSAAGEPRDEIAAWASPDGLPDANGAVLVAAGIVAAVVAIVLLTFALAPGRLARRARVTERVAVLVDDGVLADAVADAVAESCGLDRGRVTTTMRRAVVSVRVVPTSGVPLDGGRAREAADAATARAGFPTRASVSIARDGALA